MIIGIRFLPLVERPLEESAQKRFWGREFLILIFCIHTSAQASSWEVLAERVTDPFPSIRSEAINELRLLPNLEGHLRAALGSTKRHLALDVICSLSLYSLLPDLVMGSLNDDDGAFHLAINALLTVSNRDQIAKLYRERIEGPRRHQFSAPVRAILLDTLGRMGIPLRRRDLKVLLRDPSYDVREAALYYVRHMLLYGKRAEYLPLLEQVLTLDPYQLRLQTLSVVRELPLFYRALVLPQASACERENQPEVRRACEQVFEGAG